MTDSICSKHGVADPSWAAREEARDAAVLGLQMWNSLDYEQI
jgi:hypothetical protein